MSKNIWERLMEAQPGDPVTARAPVAPAPGQPPAKAPVGGAVHQLPPELDSFFRQNPTRGDVNVVSMAKKGPTGNPVVYSIKRPDASGKSFILPQERILKAFGKGSTEDLATWIKTIGEFHVEQVPSGKKESSSWEHAARMVEATEAEDDE